jgi:hypothetical protein
MVPAELWCHSPRAIIGIKTAVRDSISGQQTTDQSCRERRDAISDAGAFRSAQRHEQCACTVTDVESNKTLGGG